MDAKELRLKSAAELKEELLSLRREQFNLRMSQATGQAAKPDQFTKVRRNIARLKTVISEQGQPVKVTAKATDKVAGKVVGKVTRKAKGASK